MQNIKLKRLRISEVSELNDPFEMTPCDLTDGKNRQAVLKLKDQFGSARGPLCFTRSWKNPVLWAHYAEKHHGICLGFDVPDSPADARIGSDDLVKPMEYVKERIAWRDPDQDFVHQLIFTKFNGWAYEEELRMYATRDVEENGHYFIEFSENLSLKEVILGHRCCVARGRIMAMLRNYPDPVRIFKARLSFSSFVVEEDPNGFND